ncbi:hypothetical protein [Shouchella shacheensis]|uniref:hypothetical protein n=1 Tax=Shouchella shacheensis TaxID=1649580 RepID=UPI00074022CE|nr:hypothetical protein [Shouchella shacheensis]
MDVLPFSHTWPYDVQGKDIYFESCPFCGTDHVLTHMKMRDLKLAKEHRKVNLVMPCCHEVMTILEADNDYMWANRPLRR